MKEADKVALLEEIQAFGIQTKKFMNKKVSVKDFKGYSGGFGSYAQRGGDAFMLRLRMNQGIITKDKLKFICDICEYHHVTKAHFTTCQTIQLHDVLGEALAAIMSSALDHGIICRGGGGDYPRNVMCPPLSGVDPDETFDVYPYAKVVGDYLLSIINTFQLPRKLKIAFANSERNETHATFRDLGFIANVDHTFDVYCAGGLGNNPRMGVKVGDHIASEDVLHYVCAMISIFKKHGNYENRAKARTRYMQETLGVERLQKEFKQYMNTVASDTSLPSIIPAACTTKQGHGELIDPRATPQKQSGLYSIYYHPIGGTLSIQQLRTIYTLIATMDDVELRITPQQGVYIINCTAQEGRQILEATMDSAQNEFETSVACIGASTCQVGLRDSQATLMSAIQYLRKHHYPDHTLPRIFISGCPSSCGTSQIGRIGFQGTVKVIDKIAHPAYQFSLYGNDQLHMERFGDVQGIVLERDVCQLLESIAQRVMEHHCDYSAWIATFPEEILQIVQKFLYT